jgi:hypothetical protein
MISYIINAKKVLKNKDGSTLLDPVNLLTSPYLAPHQHRKDIKHAIALAKSDVNLIIFKEL